MDVDIEELAKVYDLEVIEYVLFLIKEEEAFTQLIEFDYKHEEVPRLLFGCVKNKIMKSQVLNRKPRLIRVRTNC